MVHLKHKIKVFVSAACLAAGMTTAAATQTHGLIEAAASENYFSIEPGFTGTSIIFFGSVDQDKIVADFPDIAITVYGPQEPVTVWKKERRGIMWVNSESLTFEDVPTFYGVMTSRPLDDIAPLEERKRFEIGIDALYLSRLNTLPESNDTPGNAEFRDGLIRIKKAHEMFVQNPDAIEWLGKRLFRARINLPAAAGAGLYRARIFVLQNRKVIAETNAQVTLRKVGIERFLYTASTEQPLIYVFAPCSSRP